MDRKNLKPFLKCNTTNQMPSTSSNTAIKEPGKREVGTVKDAECHNRSRRYTLPLVRITSEEDEIIVSNEHRQLESIHENSLESVDSPVEASGSRRAGAVEVQHLQPPNPLQLSVFPAISGNLAASSTEFGGMPKEKPRRKSFPHSPMKKPYDAYYPYDSLKNLELEECAKRLEVEIGTNYLQRDRIRRLSDENVLLTRKVTRAQRQLEKQVEERRGEKEVERDLNKFWLNSAMDLYARVQKDKKTITEHKEKISDLERIIADMQLAKKLEEEEYKKSHKQTRSKSLGQTSLKSGEVGGRRNWYGKMMFRFSRRRRSVQQASDSDSANKEGDDVQNDGEKSGGNGEGKREEKEKENEGKGEDVGERGHEEEQAAAYKEERVGENADHFENIWKSHPSDVDI